MVSLLYFVHFVPRPFPNHCYIRDRLFQAKFFSNPIYKGRLLLIDYFMECFSQVFYGVGLGNNTPEAIICKLTHNRVIRIPARYHCPYIRVYVSEPLYCFPSPIPPGTVKSIMTRSKALFSSLAFVYNSIASSPSVAYSTSYPILISARPTDFLIIASSSIMSTLALLLASALFSLSDFLCNTLFSDAGI